MNKKELLKRLPPRERRGSKPRCYELTEGTREAVAERLTRLIQPFGIVRSYDICMPQGFGSRREAELHRLSELIIPELSKELKNWWLAVESGQTRTPNWDIASTCLIDGKPGLLLVEAKAHDHELIHEEKGKDFDPRKASPGQHRNHEKIAAAIREANVALNLIRKGWNLSRDKSYQMHSRIAWSWKIAELSQPVILVYLGFLNASEMRDRGEVIRDASHWENLVKNHGGVPPDAWGERIVVNGRAIIPLIRVVEQSLRG